MCDLCFVTCFTFHISLSSHVNYCRKWENEARIFVQDYRDAMQNASTIMLMITNYFLPHAMWYPDYMRCVGIMHVFILWNEWIVDKSEFPIPWEKINIKTLQVEKTRNGGAAISLRTWLLKFYVRLITF